VYEALESSGIPSSVGATAEAALAQRGLPRVALVDLMLPDENGLEVARRLCARDPTIRIIFVTAYADELLSRVTADQVPALIVKPFDLAELVARVRDAMAEPR
jgi:DNA-binding response OmpR family regulator